MNPVLIGDFEQQLQSVTGLVSLPEVYLKFKQLMDDELSDVDDFAAVVRLDPNLSIAVLKLVNSAYFGFPKSVSSLTQATNLIGMGQLHNLVLSLSAMTSLKFPNNIMPLQQFWQMSLYAGVLARLLARQLNLKNSDQLFVMGLLHNIGHLVLYAKFPEFAVQSIELAQNQELEVYEAEQQLLDCHYGDIGALLMMQWGLPKQYQEVTRHHPRPEQATDYRQETALIQIAHFYARQQIASDTIIGIMEVQPLSWELSQLSADTITGTLESAFSITADMANILQV